MKLDERPYLRSSSGALAGGAAWTAVVVMRGYAVGYVATGIGLFAGFAVHFAVRSQQDLIPEREWVRLQLVAASSAPHWQRTLRGRSPG